VRTTSTKLEALAVIALAACAVLTAPQAAAQAQNAQRCTTIDTDVETTVEIPAKNAEVLTPQATSSYALEADGDHTLLRIIDPKEFRKVRHLVIVTKTA
jgi:hypothetical protein